MRYIAGAIAFIFLYNAAFAAAPDDLRTAKWVQVSVATGTGSTLMSVKNCPSLYGASCYGLQHIMGAWSGGVFATSLGARGSLLVWGGGHDHYRGNEIYTFDVATGRWRSLTNPVDPPNCNFTTSTMVGGTNSPCAAHTYDYPEFSRSTNEFFKLGSASDDYSVTGTGNVHAYNVLTNTWRVATPFATWENPPSDDGEGATSAWDTTRNVLWWHGSWRAHATSNRTLRRYDPATNAITEYVGAKVGIDGAMAYAGHLDALVLIDGRENEDVYGFDLSSGTPVVYSLTVSGTSNFPSGMGFDYDPVARKFVGYDTGSSVYTLSPPAGDWRTGTWIWANIAAGSGSANPGAAAGNGTWGRFRYVPAMCGFIVVNDVSKPTYMYQLAGGSGSGCLASADAVDDAFTMEDPGPASIPILANDVGFTDPVTVGITVPPLHGMAEINGSPGSRSGIDVTYTPQAAFSGIDSFDYAVDDGMRTDSATVMLDVRPAAMADSDADGVLDLEDNCMLVTNPNQCDSDGDGFGNHCDADLNNDGATNAFDTPLYRAQLGQPSVGPIYSEADLNCNGFVNAIDTPLFRSLFGSPPGPSGLVP